MPRAYRNWMTPLALLSAVVVSAATSLGIGLAASRSCGACRLRLNPVGSDRVLQVGTAALVASVALVTVVGGLLQLVAVRPADPRLLVRSAALQTGVAATGPALLLDSAVLARLLLIALLAEAAFLPAVGLSGVTLLRGARFRPIQRRTT